MERITVLVLFTVILGGEVLSAYVVSTIAPPTNNVDAPKNNIDEAINTLAAPINKYYPSANQALDFLERSLKKFMHTTEDVITDIQDASTVYLSNLDNSRISRVLKDYSGSECLGVGKLDGLKESFKLEIGLMEIPLKSTIGELKDKLQDLRRSLDLQRDIQEVRSVPCRLTKSGNCSTGDVKSCTNGTCSPDKFDITELIEDNTKESSEIPQQKAITSSSFHRIPMPTECADGRFRCQNSNCIELSRVCDGSHNCHDGSDENYGQCERECSGKRCRNLKCIAEEDICDGVNDCEDGTDEEHCITNKDECKFTSGKFLCKNGYGCLDLRDVCNDRKDCPDSSDEGAACNKTELCNRCTDAGGSCFLTPTGPQCLRKCPTDFSLNLKTGVCVVRLSESDPYIFYDDESLMGTLEKLKILTKRFSKGYVHLKKHLNYMLEKVVNEFSSCRQKGEISLSQPFSIF